MLTTLDKVKAELREDSNSVVDDATEERFILDQIDVVTERIYETTRRTFIPTRKTEWIESKLFRDGGTVKDDTLYLLDPLQELLGITIGETVISLSNATPIPAGDEHYWRIRLTGTSWLSDRDIYIEGIWAYRKVRSQGWINSRATVVGSVDDTDYDITVSDVDGVDARLEMPQFSPGQLIRIDDEFLQVRAVNVDDNIISVIRGVNGTEASAYAGGETILTWYPEPSIQRAATRWAMSMYRRRAQLATTQTEGLNAIQYPPDAPEDVMMTLGNYRRIGSVRKV